MNQRPESIVDYRELPPERGADLSLLRNEVAQSLRLLTHSERIVLQLRYGLAPHSVSYTLEEAARILKTNRSRIRGIECKAITKLRAPSRCENLLHSAFPERHEHRFAGAQRLAATEVENRFTEEYWRNI